MILEKEMIAENFFRHYKKIENPFKSGEGCVDGRKSKNPNEPLRPQLLGGSLLPAVTFALLRSESKEKHIAKVEEEYIRRQSEIVRMEVHSDTHAEHEHSEKSGCGFADFQPDILTMLIKKEDEIWGRIISVMPDFSVKVDERKKVIGILKSRESDIQKMLKGKELTGIAKKYGAKEMILDGNHNEKAVLVNLDSDMAYDAREANREADEAFNFDLGHFKKLLKKLGHDEEYVQKAELFALGAYVATEMILVENKGNPALPVYINTPISPSYT